MTRVNLLLLAIAIACALGVVTSQHQARKLIIAMQQEKERAQKMEVEWGQLQLEQSTWSMPARVENIVINQLRMQQPKPAQTRYIHLDPAAGQEVKP
ncbi:MAG: cell division protein FtsL [Nitrosomonadales bacterium]|nr:cell division protein FtsL [Nitrosomonadales bacterium]